MIIIELFPFKPFREIEVTSNYPTQVIQFESGKKQVQRKTISKEMFWKFKLSGLNSERLELEAFFDRQGGDAGEFYFVDQDGTMQTVRFSQSKLPITIKKELNVPIAYECEIVLEKVI